jgi:ABC-2 type transport system permease protein
MNTIAQATPEVAPQPQAAVATAHRIRPLYWSLRRELWENRSLYIAPLAAGGVVLFAFMVGLRFGSRHFAHMRLDTEQLAMVPYDIAALVIVLTTLVVAVFYCLGALHNERRDRSILFWKSLPVSDLVTVASKAVVPFVVLPLVAFAVTVVTQLIMLVIGTAALAATGGDTGILWTNLPILNRWLVLLYGVFALALWHAPVYGWLMLVSGWARRAPFLWAFGVPIAGTIFEVIAFGTSAVGSFFWARLVGGFSEAFTRDAGHRGSIELSQLDPVGFLSNPDLWIGLVLAALFLGGCVWLRRYREPV